MRSDDIVRLVTAPNPFVAHAWQQALEEQGIRAQVVGDYLEAGVGNMPGLTPEVWVHRDDVTRAQEILRQGQEGEPEA
jgi:hypothetical protein